MQLYNKEASKRIFAHTWYIYPLLVGIITIMWLWGFQAFHQPTAHQTIVMFFGASVKDQSFAKSIKEEHYTREGLREVEIHGALPDHASYGTMLKLYIQKADILVLDKKTLDDFKGYQDRFFVDIDSELQQKYNFSGYDYYTYEDDDHKTYNYGIKIKSKNVDNYLSKHNYMVFDEGYDYYACFGLGSTNLGYIGGEYNEKYDNALTYMKYLLDLHD